MEGSYHVSNHVVHHPKHIYKATCLIKRKREQRSSQSGKRHEERTTDYLQKTCCLKRKTLIFFHILSVAQKKNPKPPEFGVALLSILSGCIAQCSGKGCSFSLHPTADALEFFSLRTQQN